MKHYRVKMLGQACSEFAISNAWWCIHRPESLGLLRTVVLAAIDLLAKQPEVGALERGSQQIRRLALLKTHYAIYYRVDPKWRRVEILAFWHKSREHPTL